MLVIMASMDQKECYVWPYRKLRIFRSCSASQIVAISFDTQRQFLMVQAIQQTTETPQSFVYGGRCPCLCWRAGSRLLFVLRQSRSHSAARRHYRRGTEADPMVQTVRLTIDIAQLLYTVIDVPVVQDERSTCAVVEKTVVLPRLHCRGFRLENSSSTR